jgi:hypothetical protein
MPCKPTNKNSIMKLEWVNKLINFAEYGKRTKVGKVASG